VRAADSSEAHWRTWLSRRLGKTVWVHATMFARSDFGLSTPGQFFAPLSGSSTPWIEQDLSEADTSDPTKTLKKWSSLIGIVTAIVGNVLIALALNVQRYAHIQLHRRRAQVRERARQAVQRATKAGPDGGQNGTKNGGYGTVRADGNGLERRVSGGSARSDASGLHGDHFEARDTNPLIQRYDERREEEEGEGGAGGVGDDHDDHDDGKNKAVSTYLKSPYWWLGQVLITVGEMGNFLAYGFAPASIVSPLGVVALISNSVIAPFLFNETFRKRDFWGVVVAAAGAVTVVLSAKQQETKLGPHDVWDAITTTEFEVYVAITLALIAVLMWASPRYGNRTILIDLGLVGLFGGLLLRPSSCRGKSLCPKGRMPC
jgi:drug/metabolite transporter (DMT)-like permease